MRPFLFLANAFFVFLMATSSLLHAEVGPRTCFEGKFPFFQNINRLNIPFKEKAAILKPACQELSDADAKRRFEEKSIKERVFIDGGAAIAFGLGGGALSAFTTLDDDKEQRQFAARLEAIKKIPNPMNRIKLVYDLVLATQGVYDTASESPITGRVEKGKNPFKIYNPKTALKNAKELGTVGVCRHQASFLLWSLQQVQRGPVVNPSDKNRMDLGPTDFSVTYMAGYAQADLDVLDMHAWIRVNLPVHNTKGQIVRFNHFDLDNSKYNKEFTILFPRRSGLTQENHIKTVQQCSEVQNCLNEQK